MAGAGISGFSKKFIITAAEPVWMGCLTENQENTWKTPHWLRAGGRKNQFYMGNQRVSVKLRGLSAQGCTEYCKLRGSRALACNKYRKLRGSRALGCTKYRKLRGLNTLGCTECRKLRGSRALGCTKYCKLRVLGKQMHAKLRIWVTD